MILCSHRSSTPLPVVGSKGLLLIHKAGVERKQAAVEFGWRASIGVAAQHVTEQGIVTGIFRCFAGRLYVAALPEVVPPPAGSLFIFGGYAGHGCLQLPAPEGYIRRLFRMECDTDMFFTHRPGRAELPGAIVRSGIFTAGNACILQVIAPEFTAKGEVRQRVHHLILHGIQALLGHGYVKHGPLRVTMIEDNAIPFNRDAVRGSKHTFGRRPSIGVLPPLALADRPVPVTPVFVTEINGHRLTAIQLEMRYRMEYIRPKPKGCSAGRDFDISVVKH